ncbi:MAG: hypothetical protein COA66_06110 [Arcobacter sp.]|nr:MAG: hypothetical protein COA66_06110 [Arcobacter sp.]
MRWINLGICLLIFSSEVVLAIDQITWGKYDYPPYYIHKGELKGQGSEDQLVQLFQKHLKEYQHKNQNMPIARFSLKAEAGEKFCMSGLYKTSEREKIFAVSIPTYIGPNEMIIIEKEKLGHLGHPKTIAFEELLQNQKLRGVFQKRSLGNVLGPILEKYQHQPNVQVRSYKSKQVYGMLLLNRVDYTIDTIPTIIYLEKISGKSNRMTSLEIQEVSQSHIYISVVCPKNAWGQRVITRINEIIQSEKSTPQYRAIIEQWYDEHSRQQLRKVYDEVFMNWKSK